MQLGGLLRAVYAAVQLDDITASLSATDDVTSLHLTHIISSCSSSISSSAQHSTAQHS